MLSILLLILIKHVIMTNKNSVCYLQGNLIIHVIYYFVIVNSIVKFESSISKFNIYLPDISYFA